MKKLLTILLVAFSLQTFSQACTVPTVKTKKVGHSYRFTVRDDAETIYRVQWKSDTGNVWMGKDVQLSANTSRSHCVGYVCDCTFGVIEGQTISSSLFYGIQDGWVVRFAKKCADGSWSSFTQEFTVNL